MSSSAALTPPLEGCLRQAKARGDDPAQCGFELCRSILLAVREARASRPDLVVKYGCYLLHNHAQRLGHEVWAMYEQVDVALLQAGKRIGKHSTTDSSELALARQFSATLCATRQLAKACRRPPPRPPPTSPRAPALGRSAQVPDSQRVKRLEGMLWEATGEAEEANNVYEDILKDDPSNLQAMKRQVALLRARGRPAEAARKLVDHLGVVCSDADAWLVLCDLYLSQQQYAKAKFCMEELLLLNPMAYIYHVRYGEILFTMGAAERGGNDEHVRTARKNYAHALELKPTANLRALYGLVICCATLPKGTKGRESAAPLLSAAQKSMLDEYAAAGADEHMRKVVASAIKTLTD